MIHIIILTLNTNNNCMTAGASSSARCPQRLPVLLVGVLAAGARGVIINNIYCYYLYYYY